MEMFKAEVCRGCLRACGYHAADCPERHGGKISAIPDRLMARWAEAVLSPFGHTVVKACTGPDCARPDQLYSKADPAMWCPSCERGGYHLAGCPRSHVDNSYEASRVVNRAPSPPATQEELRDVRFEADRLAGAMEKKSLDVEFALVRYGQRLRDENWQVGPVRDPKEWMHGRKARTGPLLTSEVDEYLDEKDQTKIGEIIAALNQAEQFRDSMERRRLTPEWTDAHAEALQQTESTIRNGVKAVQEVRMAAARSLGAFLKKESQKLRDLAKAI
jgi:hypothetical protein